MNGTLLTTHSKDKKEAMHNYMPCLVLAAAICFSARAGTAAADLTAENTLTKGWGAGGWGSYRFVVKNPTDTVASIVKWTARWQAAGKPIGDSWGGDLNETLPAHGEWKREEVGELPMDVAKAAADHPAVIAGSITVRRGESTQEMPFNIEIPVAVLPETLKRIEGKTVGLELMASRFKEFKHLARTLEWIDQSYMAMIDLTGEKPFGGKLMVFKEAPAHPWWAYAGKEMVLNTNYVGSTLKDFDNGIMSFGWVHEVGHNFDVLGDWYIWNGASAECQANFKLAYAIETIPDQSFRMSWIHTAPGYPAPVKDMPVTGLHKVDSFFLLFGDKYLADPSQTWDKMSSDDICSFFIRLQRAYGWAPFRQLYRTYRRLNDAGKKPPATPEEKANLVAAILSKECRVDLLPVFQRWRFPVSPEQTKAMAVKYGIDRG